MSPPILGFVGPNFFEALYLVRARFETVTNVFLFRWKWVSRCMSTLTIKPFQPKEPYLHQYWVSLASTFLRRFIWSVRGSKQSRMCFCSGEIGEQVHVNAFYGSYSTKGAISPPILGFFSPNLFEALYLVRARFETVTKVFLFR